MQWSVLRGELRQSLGEEETTEADSRYTDEVLLSVVNDGLRRLAAELPILATCAISAVNGQEDYTLPANFVSAQAVIYPDGIRRTESVMPLAGSASASFYGPFGTTIRRRSQQFGIDRTTLHLRPAPDDIEHEPTIVLSYYRNRDEVVDENQEVDVSSDELLLLKEWMRAFLMSTVIGPDALLSRWKERGQRDDNPLLPAVKSFYQQFDEMLETIKRNRRPAVMELIPTSMRRSRYGRR
jgi:hypothetical protein